MMFPSAGGMSSLTTSLTRPQECLVWRWRAAWWWEVSHWVISVWVERVASERRERSSNSLSDITKLNDPSTAFSRHRPVRVTVHRHLNVL